jgi:homocitrate synthase NifV
VGSAAHHNVLPWQPIVGDNVFAHESGIHAKGMLKDTSTFEPFPPHIVGGERRYVLGKHSGRALVAWMLDNAGVPSEEADLMACLEIARQRSIDKAGPLSSEELVEIHRSLQDVIR